jgi:predicted metal-binding membrane protein
VRRRDLFLPLLGLLIGLSWTTLWCWERSPYGRYLDHGDWLHIGLTGAICQALPAGDILFPALLIVGGWLMMTAAMMLPTTLPLLEMFRRMTISREDRNWLLALLVGGYLAVWAAFGLLAHILDLGLHEAASDSRWLTTNSWVLAAAALIGAGLFQFSPLKYRCLDRCRSPLGFLLGHWHGRSARREAFLLGVLHGAFCVGCCWALMLAAFALGMGNLGLMLLFGALMAIEKNLPWGRKLGPPLGFALTLWGIAIAAAGFGLVA